jgi:two-component system OmpR family sensor kinase
VSRHFLGLYLLIVSTLAAVSWGQDRLFQTFGNPDTADDGAVDVATAVVALHLADIPAGERRAAVAALAARSHTQIELLNSGDIAGPATLARLERGEIARMHAGAGAGENWALKRIDGVGVLAFESLDGEARRAPVDWVITIAFYAVIALVIMVWIWPLTRDLRKLEQAAASFGNRNWAFEATISPRSQIFALAETFRRMAARIDELISSHKDMSNAVAHEIKTPLARMKFEIELARGQTDAARIAESLDNVKRDIGAIDELVNATLAYAILERADLAINVGEHDLTALIPAIAAAVARDAEPGLAIRADVAADGRRVLCDAHLFEAILKNLLYNASRYAKREICVTFRSEAGLNRLTVDDDGPGIPERDRRRVFDSFVQLEPHRSKKTGFGLGLAIVKRAVEWHGGTVTIADSPAGGARFSASWPAEARPRS